MTPRVGVRCTPYGHLDVGAISPEEQAEILASLHVRMVKVTRPRPRRRR